MKRQKIWLEIFKSGQVAEIVIAYDKPIYIGQIIQVRVGEKSPGCYKSSNEAPIQPVAENPAHV